jgi:hypothetical protein
MKSKNRKSKARPARLDPNGTAKPMTQIVTHVPSGELNLPSNVVDYELRSVDPNIPTEPPAGTYAATARFMSTMFPDFDWDAWKDEMKDRDY